MDFSDLIRSRQSVRKYSDKTVEAEKIQKLVEAVHVAPSACNSQPWKLIIVDNRELARKVAKATFSTILAFNRFAIEAPAFAILVIEKAKGTAQIGGNIKNREFPLIDIGIAAEHFCLQATELGLGTCMIGWFNEKKIKQLLQIPEKKRVGLLISFGYPPEGYKLRKKIRKQLEEMSSFNKY